MLLILFKLGDRRYGLDSRQVVEVVPTLPVREVPGTPPSVVGIFECRGRVAPVIDLCLLTVGRPARDVLSSRYLLVQADESGERILALLAEQVIDTLSVDEKALRDPGLVPPDAPHLGKVIKDADGEMVQCVEVSELLTPEILALLRKREVAAT